jgi:hypothetical protein
MKMMMMMMMMMSSGDMSIVEFFRRYVYHSEECEKGLTSDVCTCGLMQNLPRVLSGVIVADAFAKRNKVGPYE